MTEKEVLQNEFWKFWQPIRQLSGKVKYEKKTALSKVFSSCDFIKGLSGSYQALLTISMIPETVSSETWGGGGGATEWWLSLPFAR